MIFNASFARRGIWLLSILVIIIIYCLLWQGVIMNTILQGIVVTVGNENVENSVYVDTSILEPFEDKSYIKSLEKRITIFYYQKAL